MARFDCAVWRPISANTSGRLGPNLGLVLHHAVANGSLWSFFNSPSAQVSAHFWVAKSGYTEQYVDTDVIAWHGKSLNTRYVGVETEGCTAATNYAEPMTTQMIDALAALYAEGMRRHGWPKRLANSDGEAGFGYHRMAVNTACPCDVRLSKRQEILDKATGVVVEPEPEPLPEVIEMALVIPTFHFNAQHHIFSLSKAQGQLWHKWSHNAVDWPASQNECLLATEAVPGAVRIPKKLVDIAGGVVTDSLCMINCVDEDSRVWICRQAKGETQWDRRQMP